MNAKNSYLCGAVALIVAIMLIAVCISNYKRQLDAQIRQADLIFERVIPIELELMLANVPIYNFPSNTPTDSISIETEAGKTTFERPAFLDSISDIREIQLIDQLYISAKNPNRVFILDSLFQEQLQEKGIQAKTGIQCIANGITTNSEADSSFLTYAVALPPLVYGTPEQPQLYVRLQAYIQFSPFYILRQISTTLCLSSLMAIFLLTICYFLFRKKRTVIIEHFVTIPRKELNWLKILDTLCFEESQGILKYNEVEIRLVGKRLILLAAFLKAPKYFLSYQNITGLLGYEDSQAGIRNLITQSINVLKKDLEFIPTSILSIQNVRGKGYFLALNAEDTMTNEDEIETDEIVSE